ncbi:alpha/beta hydrolase [Flaviaesturariibacter amylovorans]|uniref:Alpha/beta hydrolase n=1 Tax=Flaviaesturariibacter amylovorans TaxID=1084520 RepID=A0ABP8GY07_9BACT
MTYPDGFDGLFTRNGTDLYVYHAVTHPGWPTIVFLHDSLGCTALWRDFPARLAAATQCNLLVYDRQGYGRSAPFSGPPRTKGYLEREAAVLRGLLDALSLRDVVLFGHSDGASIALIAAALQPAGIRALVSEAAHLFVEPETLQGVRTAVEQYSATNLKERLGKYHGSKTEALFRAWTDTWLDPAFRNWDITPLLPGISCPTLVIQGEHDEYGTVRQVEGIASGINGPVEVLLLPGIGHTPHKEAPEATLHHAAAFLKGLEA